MTRRWIWISLTVVLAALIFMPLRLASGIIGLDAMGVSARQVGGSVWSGRMEQTRIGGFDLGTVDVGLNPLSLLLGRARMGFERVSGVGIEPLAGTYDIGPGRRVIDGLSGTVLATGWTDLPIEKLSFEGVNVHFSDGQCRSASGRVQLMLAVRIAGLDLRNGLSGVARCEGGALLLPLAGQSGMERLTLTITGDGQYEARFGINATDPITSAALAAAGFSATAEGYFRVVRGRL